MASALIPGLVGLLIVIGLRALIRSATRLRVLPPETVILGGLLLGFLISIVIPHVSGVSTQEGKPSAPIDSR